MKRSPEESSLKEVPADSSSSCSSSEEQHHEEQKKKDEVVLEIMELQRCMTQRSSVRFEEEESLTARLRESPKERRAARRKSRRASYLCILVVLAAASAVAVLFREKVLRAAIAIGDMPRYEGGLAYAFLVAAWLFVLLPTSLLEILGGFIFGLWFAALCSSIGKMMGSYASFWVGRLNKDAVQRRFLDDDDDEDEEEEEVVVVNNAMGRTARWNTPGGAYVPPSSDDEDSFSFSHGEESSSKKKQKKKTNNNNRSSTSGGGGEEKKMSYVAGLRLAMQAKPFATCLALRLAYVPEAVQNYTPAVLDAPFPPFALATFLGSSTYAILWAKLGASLKDFDDLLHDGMSPEKAVFLVVGLLSLAAVLGLVHWNTKRTIRNFVKLQEEQEATRTEGTTNHRLQTTNHQSRKNNNTVDAAIV